MAERQTKLMEFGFVPIELPYTPELKGRRSESIAAFYAETGAHNVREAELFLVEIGWTWYDVLRAFSP